MGDVSFADWKIINSVKITLHWGKTNIHREQVGTFNSREIWPFSLSQSMKHFFNQISKQNIIFM